MFCAFTSYAVVYSQTQQVGRAQSGLLTALIEYISFFTGSGTANIWVGPAPS